MLHRLTNAFGKVYLTIYEDRAEKWLRTVRVGFQSEASLNAGLIALTDALLTTGLSCVLVDMTSVLGPISSSGKVASEWAPQAAKVGLTHMAVVVPPEAIARKDMENFQAKQKYFEIKLFDNLTDAKAWLRKA